MTMLRTASALALLGLTRWFGLYLHAQAPYLRPSAWVMVAAGLMVVTRCCRWSDAKRSIDWGVLLVIGAGLGIGSAMDQSGAVMMGVKRRFLIGPPPLHRQAMQIYGLACR